MLCWERVSEFVDMFRFVICGLLPPSGILLMFVGLLRYGLARWSN